MVTALAGDRQCRQGDIIVKGGNVQAKKPICKRLVVVVVAVAAVFVSERVCLHPAVFTVVFLLVTTVWTDVVKIPICVPSL